MASLVGRGPPLVSGGPGPGCPRSRSEASTDEPMARADRGALHGCGGEGSYLLRSRRVARGKGGRSPLPAGEGQESEGGGGLPPCGRGGDSLPGARGDPPRGTTPGGREAGEGGGVRGGGAPESRGVGANAPPRVAGPVASG